MNALIDAALERLRTVLMLFCLRDADWRLSP